MSIFSAMEVPRLCLVVYQAQVMSQKLEIAEWQM
jgi:hypothetical protein